MSRSPVDNVERLLNYRRLERFPLAVVVGVELDEVLANHVQTRDALLMQAAAVSLLLAALAWALTRHLVRLRTELVARNEAQREVAERTEQVDAIFAVSPDGFVGFDAQTRVKYVNPAFLQMTGGSTEQLVGMTEETFCAWLLSLCEPGALLEAPAAGQACRPQNIVISSGRRVLQVSSRTSPNGAVSRILYLRDVTHETAVDQIKSEFLSTAAHELRTPMASIYGFAEVLLTHEVSDADRQEFMEIIFDQAGNVSRILNELLDLARMEARRGKDFSMKELDLTALAREVIRSYKVPAGRERPEVDAPDKPMPVVGDADKLRQALLNVLSNAYKYSPDGGPVQVTFRERQHHGRQQLGMSIRDQGIGMSEEQLARVFERFFRADKSGKLPGTGLGMSIVEEIFEIHQGEVEIDSSPGHGTQVHLWLPAAGARPDPAPSSGGGETRP